MKVAITGSSGMLGQALCAEAAARGYQVSGIALFGAEHCLDVCDEAALERALSTICPGVVINTVAITDLQANDKNPGLAYRVNARTAGVLANLSIASGARLVHISTDHFFTGDGAQPHDEFAPVRLVNEYARTKYAGEHLALTAPGALVVRTNIVGFRGWAGQPTFVEWALAALAAGQPMTLFTDYYASSIAVAQLARALFDLLDRGAAGMLNVASREVASKQAFIEALARHWNYSLANTQPGSVFALKGVRRAESLGLNVSRAERLLGYALPTLAEVIASLGQQQREKAHAV